MPPPDVIAELHSMHIESVRAADSIVRFRPFTGGGSDLRAATDPINLVFAGEADAIGIRAALRTLGRGRAERWSALAEAGAVWTDAVGGAQTAYAPGMGWSAGAIQLELGEFAGLRAHLRLFPFPGFVLGAAHLERLPAGRFEHAVFSWSGAEQLVVRELERAGVVARRTSHQIQLDGARRLGEIRYADLGIPPDLLEVAGYRSGTPADGDAIPGWGALTVVELKDLPTRDTLNHVSWSRLTLDTPVMLPAIAAQANLRVRGPVDIEHEVSATATRLKARTRVTGDLVIDVAGRPLPAQIHEWQLARLGSGVGRVRTARRYLTGRGHHTTEPPPHEAALPHTVSARVDRRHGPKVSVTRL